MDNTVQKKKTLVIGASTNPERYAWRAVSNLQKHGHEVIAFGNKAGKILDVEIETEFPQADHLDTITLYMNAERQKALYEQILALHPRRIIFNPGAENEELEALAKEKGIETIEGCTLVMLSIGNY